MSSAKSSAITNRAVPVALPILAELACRVLLGGPHSVRYGPVIPLTASAAPPVEELMGGGRRAAAGDARSGRKPRAHQGRADHRPIGRADDFAWPRGSAPIAEPVALQPTAVAGRAGGIKGSLKRASRAASAQRGVTTFRPRAIPAGAAKRMRQPDAPRPPFSIFQGFFR